jgi:hypothetical protein
MAITKGNLDGVISRLDNRPDRDLALAKLQHLLPGPWPRTSALGESTRRYSAAN